MSKPRETTIIRKYEKRLRAQAGVMAAAHDRIVKLEQQLAAADAVAEALEAQKADLQRQLAEVTRERDTLKAMLDLQNLRAERTNLGSGK